MKIHTSLLFVVMAFSSSVALAELTAEEAQAQCMEVAEIEAARTPGFDKDLFCKTAIAARYTNWSCIKEALEGNDTLSVHDAMTINC